MRFGTWNVRNLYRSGSLITVARELARYKVDLVGVQEVRWNKGGTVRIRGYNNWKEFFLVHHRIVSAVTRVEFVSDRVSYILLRGRWNNTMVLNVHAPSEEKSDDSKDSFMRN
jgi:hypothetical protein